MELLKLNSEQADVLSYISHYGSLDVDAISSSTQINKSIVSAIVDDMINSGVIDLNRASINAEVFGVDTNYVFIITVENTACISDLFSNLDLGCITRCIRTNGESQIIMEASFVTDDQFRRFYNVFGTLPYIVSCQADLIHEVIIDKPVSGDCIPYVNDEMQLAMIG